MTDLGVYLLEVGAHDGTTVRTLRIASEGYVTGPHDNPADTEYPAALAEDFWTFERHLFEEGHTLPGSGSGSVAVGDVVLSNASGDFDGWIDYGFDGRPVVLKRLASRKMAYGSAVTILRATATRLDSSNGYTQLRLRLFDRRLELDKPLQANLYAGTTTSAGATAEGNADLKGKPKPLLYASADNVPAVCVNAFNQVYQVNDGAVFSIVVYDGGVGLATAGDFPTLAALVAASIAPGRFGTCLALGLFRLGGTPARVITADVVEVSAAASRRAGSVAQRLLARMGMTGSANVNAATFAALDAAAPCEVQLYLAEETKAIDALMRVLGSVGAWLAPTALGVFETGRLATPGTPVATLGAFDLHTDDPGAVGIAPSQDTQSGLPIYRVLLNYGTNWQVQDDAALAGCVSQARRTYLGAETRQVKSEDATVLTKHPQAEVLTLDTLLRYAADAQAEADRRLALYKVRRDVLTLSVRQDDGTALQPGATGKFAFPRLGYAAGRPMVVIGRKDLPARELAELTLWG